MKVIGLICFGLIFLTISNVCVEVTAQTSRCINPNQRPGVCVSIDDCQTLWSVLQRIPLQPRDEEFLYASQCQNSYADRNYLVCCSSDTGFTDTRPNYYERNYWPQISSPTKQESIPSSTVIFPEDYFDFESPSPPQAPKRKAQRTNSPKQNLSDQNTTNTWLLPKAPNCGGVAIGNRIYGGVNADLYEFPWMVLLEYRRKEGGITVDCAGTLINNRYIVTAAHCVKGPIEKNRELMAVRLGEHDTSSNVDCISQLCAPEAYRVSIEETIAHELYNDRNHENDIALIRLDRNVHFRDGVQPICLPERDDNRRIKPGAQFTVAGWGQTLKGPNSAIKQKLKVGLVDQEKCRRRFREKKILIKDTQICAGGKFSEDSCKGDSGGPLMLVQDNVWVLEGIVSFGNSCGRLNWPAVYTKVSSYTNWIRNHIKA